METIEIAKSLAELGNETRLDIFRLLVKAEPTGLTISEIGSRLYVAPSTLAFHLKGLVSANLILQTKQGRSVLCRANLNRINSIVETLQAECCRDEKECPHDRSLAIQAN